MKVDVVYNKSCQRMPELPDECIDLIATDPPYGIGFMGKEWDKFEKRKPTKSQVVSWMSPTMKKDTRGMMEFFTSIWKECLRVLKPGAFAFVMCIPRQDCLARQIISLENAGFVVNFTSLFWAYGSGFPKAQNIGKAVDKRLGVEREVVGRGKSGEPETHKSSYQMSQQENNTFGGEFDITKPASPQAQALDGSYGGFQPKPAVEVILVAMKPLSEKTYVDQALRNRKGTTWLDSARIPYKGSYDKKHQKDIQEGQINAEKGKFFGGKGLSLSSGNLQGRFPANLLVSDDALNDGKSGHSTGHYSYQLKKAPYDGGWKSLKDKGNLKENNNSFSRYFSLDAWFEKKFKELPLGVQKTFPFLIVPKASKAEKNRGLNVEAKSIKGRDPGQDIRNVPYKARSTPRINQHPTVKPLKLMSYLITLGSREGDVILDPFIGSGTTAIAARMLGRHYIGYEINKDYCEIASRRLEDIDPLFRRR